MQEWWGVAARGKPWNISAGEVGKVMEQPRVVSSGIAGEVQYGL